MGVWEVFLDSQMIDKMSGMLKYTLAPHLRRLSIDLYKTASHSFRKAFYMLSIFSNRYFFPM